MTIPNPDPYYRVDLRVGPDIGSGGGHHWSLERDPEAPTPPDYGLADYLRVTVAAPSSALLYPQPSPLEGQVSIIGETAAEFADIEIGHPLSLQVRGWPTGTNDPRTGSEYRAILNVRGKVANVDLKPHALGVLATLRFVDNSADLGEEDIGDVADWPAETLQARLTRIGDELGVPALGTSGGGLPLYGQLAARVKDVVNAAQYLTALLDSTAAGNAADPLGPRGRLIYGSVYASINAHVPSSDRWWTTGVNDQVDFDVDELPATLGDLGAGVYGVVINAGPEDVARIIEADHVDFNAAYAKSKERRTDTWTVVLADGTAVTVAGQDPVPVRGRIETPLTDARDAAVLADFNLAAGASDGWQADRFRWYADLDPEMLLWPHPMFWDDLLMLRWFQVYPVVITGIDADKNPLGRTWYAGQLQAAEFTLTEGRYYVDVQIRRNLPEPLTVSTPDPGGYLCPTEMTGPLATLTPEDLDPTLTAFDARLLRSTS